MEEKKNLHILWTSDNLYTSLHMVLMYAKNSLLRGLWEQVTVIVWGASAKLAAENEIIQDEIRVAQHVGVHFTACIACARNLGVLGDLEALGIEVIPWGPPLTELLKNGEALITI